MSNEYYLYKYNENYDKDKYTNIFYQISKVCKDKDGKVRIRDCSPAIGRLQMELSIRILDEKILMCNIEFDENKISENELISICEKYGIDLLVNENIQMKVDDINPIINCLFGKSDNDNEEYVIDYIQSMEGLVNFDTFDTMEDIFEQVYKYLEKLNVSNKTLIITDPYILYKKHFSKYKEKLIELFSKSSPKEIKFYIPNSKLCSKFYNDIFNELKDIKRININTDNYHDRFWICEEEKLGVVIGTSLNCNNTKKAYINALDAEDVDMILNDLCKVK